MAAPGVVYVQLHGKPVPVTAGPGLTVDLARCVAARPFTDWVRDLDPALSVSAIEMQSADLFGPRVGFLKFDARTTYNGRAIPSIVFMRGGAVGVLVLLRCTDGGELFALCTRQPRVPVGRSDLLELPAGMLDDEGSFVGVAAKEMREETGIELREEDLVDLTARALGLPRELAAPAPVRGVYPSAGGCDEFLRLMLHRRDVSRADLDALRGKVTGNIAEGEVITLEVVPYDELWRRCSDMKALSAMLLYERLLASKEL